MNDTLTRAAELLREHARRAFDSCEGVDRPWCCDDCLEAGGKCAAELEHDELIALAVDLDLQSRERRKPEQRRKSAR
jgi:hypothetical protein